MESIEKTAKLLRADKEDIKNLSERLGKVTDKPDALDKVIKANEEKVADRLKILGLNQDSKAEEVYTALLKKAEEDSINFSDHFENPSFEDRNKYNKVLQIIREKTASSNKGFFLKKEKAREFIKKEPPRNVLAQLGYKSVEELLEKEDLFQIFASLRFIEDRDWMNKTFFKQYDDLKPEDFEYREIEVKVLDDKWVESAKGFVEKKWHNVSHLKELGFIFIIPYSLGLPGELLRTLGLVSHYLHEVPFYSEMFEQITEVPETFDEGVASLLRGDVIERKLQPTKNRSLWLVVQRYLVKDDPNDWRLFVPHINPEGYHYLGAEEALIKMSEEMEDKDGLIFWEDTDWVGDFFEDESGNQVRISFDLMDNAFSAVREKEKVRFNYHQHEALWNKFFVEYFDRDKLYNFSKAHLLQGYFEV